MYSGLLQSSYMGGEHLLSYAIIGRNIKAARERLNLSQAQVAEMLDLSVRFYGKIERGQERPPLERIAQISEKLSVPIEALFSGSLPYMDYTNRPPTDDTEKVVAQILHGCTKGQRDVILKLASEISRLS